LIFGWTLIYLGTQYESAIQDWSRLQLGNEFIGEWSATFIMTFVNYFIPWVLSKISNLENWDFSSEVIYADLWKNYYTTILNIVFFLGFSLNDYLDSTPPSIDLGYECKEDKLVDNILKLFISEIVLRYVFYLYWNIHLKVK
jgi:hypothetical protein